MLRTRRRDNNVKPNRRLDRKSSRGMLYENEELRLKTININAEIERGQSDIKKLKRENEMLKKEIWCLRDEYDKLDKLLKDKKIDFSSSSTTFSSSSSETESCSSCTEESEEVETSQNLQNVQKTNHLTAIQDQFDHLSIVTEETSCDNSERNSTNTRQSLPNDASDSMLWNYNDRNAIKPDQSYPAYGSAIQPSRSQTLPNQVHFNCFAPIQHSKSFDDNHFSQVHQQPLYPEELYTPPLSGHEGAAPSPPIAISPSPQGENFFSKKLVQTDATNFYQNVVLGSKSARPPPEAHALDKRATDLIVKIDNQNFSKPLTYSNTTPSTTFSNGGNLEELLHDIESISQVGAVRTNRLSPPPPTLRGANQLPALPEERPGAEPQRALTDSEERLHKSELNVVLMPKAMPLIGFDKYRNIQR
ncbi:hypothetical protein HUJ05_011012 [Dendroctonus ponderosae]|nr:hypothetical protein HUJ05_011012 [Dendroctonus ponderosae]